MRNATRWFALGMAVTMLLVACGPSEREQALEAEAATLQDRINELEVTLSERSNATSELEEALEVARADREAAETALAAVQAELKTAQDERSSAYSTEAENPSAREEQLSEENRRLQAQLAAADIQTQAAQNRADTLESQNRELTDRLIRLRTGAERIETGLGDALEQLSTLEQTRQRARAQADGNAAALDAQQAVVERLQADLEGARATVVALREGLDVSDTAAESDLPPDLQEALARVAALEVERDEAQQRLRDLEDRRAALQQRLVESEASLAKLQSDIRAAVESETQALRMERDNALADLEAAEARARELTDALAEAQAVEGARDGRLLQALQVALVEAQGDVARLANARGVYTVQPADSLSSIARFFYRDGNRWPAILAANDHLIEDPDLIFTGMVLVVPELP